jgi:hypothetical protein
MDQNDKHNTINKNSMEKKKIQLKKIDRKSWKKNGKFYTTMKWRNLENHEYITIIHSQIYGTSSTYNYFQDFKLYIYIEFGYNALISCWT